MTLHETHQQIHPPARNIVGRIYNLKVVHQGVARIFTVVEIFLCRRIITHRIQTAKDATKIIIFEDGKISAVGTHEELIKKEGLYKTIYDIQNYFNESEVK